MWHRKLTKFEIAEQQLLHAIDLFCSGEKMISAVTLAGAAEEILRNLVTRAGQTHSLETEVINQCEMFESSFGRTEDPRTFYKLENEVRNELKHLGALDNIEVDLEQAAVNVIERAIYNFQLLRPGFSAPFQEFEDKAAAWWRNRSDKF